MAPEIAKASSMRRRYGRAQLGRDRRRARGRPSGGFLHRESLRSLDRRRGARCAAWANIVFALERRAIRDVWIGARQRVRERPYLNQAPSSVIRGSAEAALAGLTARWSDAESAVPEGRPPCRPFGDDLVDRNGAVPRWCAPRVPEPEHARASDRYGKIRARRGVDRIGRVGFHWANVAYTLVLRPPEWVHVTASQANRPGRAFGRNRARLRRLRCVARGFSRVVFVIRRDFEQLFATRSGRATPAG